MWVEGGDIHDELLDQLGGVLAPPGDLALTPSAEELDALALAVAARWPEGAVAPGTAVPAAETPGAQTRGEVRRLRWAGPRTRRLGSSAWRAGSVAAGLVLFSGSAAAAAGGVPLPRPVRVVAYTVGLPVDSPALDDTHQHIKELNDAVKANDTPKAEATVRRLEKDLKKVPADEKKVAVPKVEKAIELAATSGVIQAPAPTTTTTMAPTTTTTDTAPASSTTGTTEEEQKKEKEKDRSTATTTTAPTTTTTEPESSTTTTGPETGTDPGGTTGDPGSGDGNTGAGTGGDPGTTPTTVSPETTTTTTTAPPPDETTTTTTTAPEPVTTTTTTQPSTP